MQMNGINKILITGSTGLVGRNLLDYLQSSHYQVLSPARHQLDLCEYASVLDYLKKHRPGLVIHAAGKVGGIQANMNAPVSFLVDNFDIGRNVVMASRASGVRRLLNLGSSCMYPRDHTEPLREDMILTGGLEPTNEGYALAKITVARLCSYISREQPDYSYKTIIPCNIYGRYDKFDPINSHLIPAIINKIHQAKMNDQSTVEIWGDGSARREFLFAADLAEAIMRCIEQFDSLPDTMNIGLGHDYTITEYYKAVADVLNYAGQFYYNPAKPVGTARKLVDINRQRKWGWMPKYSLQDGIAKTYAYFLETYK